VLHCCFWTLLFFSTGYVESVFGKTKNSLHTIPARHHTTAAKITVKHRRPIAHRTPMALREVQWLFFSRLGRTSHGQALHRTQQCSRNNYYVPPSFPFFSSNRKASPPLLLQPPIKGPQNSQKKTTLTSLSPNHGRFWLVVSAKPSCKPPFPSRKEFP
jgi:hypothetical protein